MKDSITTKCILGTLTVMVLAFTTACGNQDMAADKPKTDTHQSQKETKPTSDGKIKTEGDVKLKTIDKKELENTDASRDAIQARSEEVFILHVVDGDTFEVRNRETGEDEMVRLLLVDTPESKHIDPDNGDLLGDEASKYAYERFDSARAYLERPVGDKTDKDGRSLGYLWMKMGTTDYDTLNNVMIEEGFARVEKVSEPNTKYVEDFKKSEAAAKEKRLNIWGYEGYVTDDGFNSDALR